jgi:uncharacterized glyoxalase superfamily protein PhnB
MAAAGNASNRSTIIPCLRYRDAPAAIDWLCKAFGFEKNAVYANPDGTIAHAQLIYGGGMVMLGSVTKEENEWTRMIAQPDRIGGLETQSPCVIVPDADAVYRSAKAAGATIVVEIRDESYGGRGFACKDPEGRLWYFGTYNPWLAPEPL